MLAEIVSARNCRRCCCRKWRKKQRAERSSRITCGESSGLLQTARRVLLLNILKTMAVGILSNRRAAVRAW